MELGVLGLFGSFCSKECGYSISHFSECANYLAWRKHSQKNELEVGRKIIGVVNLEDEIGALSELCIESFLQGTCLCFSALMLTHLPLNNTTKFPSLLSLWGCHITKAVTNPS